MKLHSPQQLMPFFVLGSIACLVLLLLAMAQDFRRPWKPYQILFSSAEAERNPAEGTFQLGIRQILVPELDRVDRCTTCHLAVDHPGYEDKGQPLKTHPPSPGHSFELFGCTICHRGNGLATTTEGAHQGMLPTSFTTASCLACHELYSLSDQERLQEGRRLFDTNGCLGCHQLAGRGGLAGPALDGVGMRYDIKWLISHFQNPAKLSPGSGMPAVQLNPQEIETLTTYVIGLVDPVTDPYFASRRVLPTPEAGRNLYDQRGCIGCHARRGMGGEVGPSFSELKAGKSESWLRFFLEQPTAALPDSTMPHPDLRPDEIDALVIYLLSSEK